MLSNGVKSHKRGESNVNGNAGHGYDYPGGLPLSSDIEADLSEIPLQGQNQRG